MKETLVLASISMCSREDKQANLAKARELLQEAKNQGADWVLLPEIFAFNGAYKDLWDNAEVEGGELCQELASLAKSLQICIFAGTVGERPLTEEAARHENGYQKVFNTLFVYDRQGQQVGKYRKTHLFNLEGHGSTSSYCEPDGFIPGNSVSRIELEGWQVGLTICYDLRFPEFFAALNQAGPLDMIVLPAAFTYATGKAHWELLLSARAVENQCFVFASNQCGEHRPGKRSYGHSMIIDPWGEKLADSGDQEGIALAKVDAGRIQEIRRRLPSLANRRPEIY